MEHQRTRLARTAVIVFGTLAILAAGLGIVPGWAAVSLLLAGVVGAETIAFAERRKAWLARKAARSAAAIENASGAKTGQDVKDEAA
jgi:hypothetical protein